MDDVDLTSRAEVAGKERQFLDDLTILCRKYGIGITGELQLFLMEWDDYDRIYRVGDASRFTFS
jgi:hypothetical protein